MQFELTNTRLLKERVVLEKCWSSKTAHPTTKFNVFSNISQGQCFVTSMYLFNLFNNGNEKNSSITIHRGRIEDLEGRCLVHDHCWLEIETNLCDNLIIDMTADQSNGIEKKVILEFINLTPINLNIKYITNKIYTGSDLLMIDLNTKNRYLSLVNNRNKINILTNAQ